MADFCWNCLAEGIYPEAPERNDLAGLCPEGATVTVLCEGHGYVEVDHAGRPVVPPVALGQEEAPSDGC